LAIPVLIKFLEFKHSEIKAAAIYSIGRYGASAGQAVDKIIPLLKANSPKVRYNAARALGEIGAEAYEALPKLKILEDDNRSAVRQAAKEAAGQIVRDYSFRHYSDSYKIANASRYSVLPSWWFSKQPDSD
jgi:HEAT repeat protein